jgi:hypothetical protein
MAPKGLFIISEKKKTDQEPLITGIVASEF